MIAEPTFEKNFGSSLMEYGLRVRFFQKELFLTLAELGGAQSVEAKATDFILDMIEQEWQFPVACIEEDSDNPADNGKKVWIKVSPPGKSAPERAKLEARIGYTADPTSSMGYRNHHTSITPFNPDAVQISYFEPGMSQPLTDFGFTQTYRWAKSSPGAFWSWGAISP